MAQTSNRINRLSRMKHLPPQLMSKGLRRRAFLTGSLGLGGMTLSQMLGIGRAQADTDQNFDVIVIGSGAAGMVAAMRAASLGQKVVVVEKASKYGGSTARSGAGIWIRNNRILKENGVEDSEEEAFTYLKAVGKGHVGDEKIRAFVQKGPEMLDFVMENSPLGFRYLKGWSDYYPNLRGSKPEGASIEPTMFDGNLLGRELTNLEPPYIPVPEGVTVYSGDYKWLTLAAVSGKGVWAGSMAVLRYFKAILKNKKPLTMGQALSGGLRAGLIQGGIPLWLNTPMEDLVSDETGRITGVKVWREGQPIELTATKGVLVAAGGFEKSQAMRDQYHNSQGKMPSKAEWSAGAAANTGDGIRAGKRQGAALDLMDEAWWGPLMPLKNGEVYFCLSERSLPGSIMVNGDGERFTNESSPYTDVVDDMYKRNVRDDGTIPTWLIADQNFRNRYLFKDVMAGSPLKQEWYDSGAIVKAESLAELAGKINLPVDSLEATVARFNEFAATGEDLDFHRGENEYDRFFSDPSIEPNPSLAPLTEGPFYAFKIVPGDISTKGGLVTDEHSRVLRPDGSVISGLYSAGNSSNSVMGRSYSGAGATLGPAMTFGYIAAEHAAKD